MSKPRSKPRSAGSPALNATVRIGYQVLFTLLLVLASPFLLIKMMRRGQWREDFGQRFGFYRPELIARVTGREILWLNAVSVGEVNLTTELVTRLKDRLPEMTVVVSTTTTTGMLELKRRLPDGVVRIYYPIDLQSAVRRAIATLRPRAIILIEADFWPNLLWEAQAAEVPVLLVNALISERSARRYQRLGFLFGPLFATFDQVFCADPSDPERLVSLGFRPDGVEVVGHPKFDAAQPPAKPQRDVRCLLDSIGLTHTAPILLGGSTHAGEESILARTYLALRPDHPDLFLIIVPRHFERSDEVARELASLGLSVILRTTLPIRVPDLAASPCCLVVNTTGELRDFYGEADIVFVGKSFRPGGGQNPIEPAIQGKAILTGPKMGAFRPILTAFLEANALLQVQTETELEASIRYLIDHPNERKALGQRARAVVEANQGALERTADGIAGRLRAFRPRPTPAVL